MYAKRTSHRLGERNGGRLAGQMGFPLFVFAMIGYVLFGMPVAPRSDGGDGRTYLDVLVLEVLVTSRLHVVVCVRSDGKWDLDSVRGTWGFMKEACIMRTVSLEHVKGYSGRWMNERAD